MKNKLSILLLSAMLFSVQVSAQSFDVMSYNIRFADTSTGANSWSMRSEMIQNLLLFHQTDILGLQEVTYTQMEFLAKILPEYSFYGVGREDGKYLGEFCPIFFKKDKFKLVNSGTFWLSEDPTVPGTRGWDAIYPRIVSWVFLQEIESKKKFYVFNTEFDHEGTIARLASAYLLIDKIAEMVDVYPLVLTGDLNFEPDTQPYKVLAESVALTDAKTLCSLPHVGSNATYNGFDLCKPLKKELDYIFIKGEIKVEKHATFACQYEKGFPSDHFPVYIKMSLK